MINTGNKAIPANVPVMWDAPFSNTVEDDKYREKVTESECGAIKGHPEGIVYPAVRAYQEENVAARIIEVVKHHLESDLSDPTDKDKIKYWLSEKRQKENDRTKLYNGDSSQGVTGDVLPAPASGAPTTNVTYDTQTVKDWFSSGKGGNENLLKKRIAAVLMERQRIIGWSLNHAHVGEQLDIILKKG